MSKIGKVYIMGAGPGDAELLTLKGKRAIEEADCIVYDRLINPRILNFAKEGAELIYLGKGNCEGGVIQEEINNTIVQKAKEGKIELNIKHLLLEILLMLRLFLLNKNLKLSLKMM